MTNDRSPRPISSLYAEVTDRIIAELEAGRLPWVQPWKSSEAGAGMPCNAGTGRRYSGINVLILWATLFDRGYRSQGWLTYMQAQSLGGHVRKGESGTTVCYADRFTPRADDAQLPLTDGAEQRQVAFLKRFTVFNVDQCEGLPSDLAGECSVMTEEAELIPEVAALIEASGANFHIGGDCAFYAPPRDMVCVPAQSAFDEPINWYRTALHELGHWTGHASRLDRFGVGSIRAEDYAREELVAEMCSAFACAELGIVPTVRHADYIGSWLAVLKNDNRAIFRAASKASKAAEYLLSFRPAATDASRLEMAA